MAKVTSKLQVTLPKVLAQQYGIRPGDDIDWIPAGDAIRVVLAGKSPTPDTTENKLRLFDQATARLRTALHKPAHELRQRGWSREDLYDRGRPRRH